MKKKKPEKKIEADEMRPEYDFSGQTGIRGKYYRLYQKGHSVKVHKGDGTFEEHRFSLEEGAILLSPDVREYFPDSESVNFALRSLIPILAAKQTADFAKKKFSTRQTGGTRRSRAG